MLFEIQTRLMDKPTKQMEAKMDEMDDWLKPKDHEKDAYSTRWPTPPRYSTRHDWGGLSGIPFGIHITTPSASGFGC
jgi:hypothetical protein